MKLWAIGLGFLALAFGSGATATEHTTTQSGSYVFGALLEDCDTRLGVACFAIGRSDLQSIHVRIDDMSPFPVTGYVSVYGPGGVQIGGGGQQFCESADVPVPTQQIQQIIVHVGGVIDDECGPFPFIDPFEGKTAYFTPATTGTVTISY